MNSLSTSSLLGPFWLWRWSRESTCVAAPRHRRSAIRSNVIVVSRRKRAAMRTCCGSLLRRSWRSGVAQPRASNSSWAIRWAFAIADCRTSSPPSCGAGLPFARPTPPARPGCPGEYPTPPAADPLAATSVAWTPPASRADSCSSDQTPGMHLPVGLLTRFSQCIQEQQPVLVVRINRLPPVPSCRTPLLLPKTHTQRQEIPCFQGSKALSA